jgi:hypothetical protein
MESSPIEASPRFRLNSLASRWWLVAACLLVIVIALMLGLSHHPVEYYDYMGLQIGTYARYFAQMGAAPFHFQNVENILPDGEIVYYTHRPSLIPLALSLVYRITSDPWTATRAAGLVVTVGMLIAFYAVIAQIADRSVAGLATLIFAVWPANLAQNARLLFWESTATAFALLLLAIYLAWLRKPSPRRLLLLLAVALIGSFTSWEFYPMSAVILVHWAFYARRDPAHRGSVWLVLVVNILVLISHLLIGLSIGGTAAASIQEGAIGRLAEGRGGGSLLTQYLFLARVFLAQMAVQFGPVGGLLTGIAAVMTIRGIVQTRALAEDSFWLLGLGAYGVAFFVIVRGILPGHDFLMLLVMPVTSLACALGLLWMLQWAKRQTLRPVILVGAVIGLGAWSVYGVSQRMSLDYALPGHALERELAFDDSMFVHTLLQPGERALTSFSLDRFDLFYFGPDRRYVEGCILTLADFETAMTDSIPPHYYVMHLRQLPDQPPDPSLPMLVYSRCHDEPIDSKLLDFLHAEGYPSRDDGIYRVVMLASDSQ